MTNWTTSYAERVEKVAKAICAERCAYMGEPACWQLKEDDRGNPLPWPAPACDDPGCIAMAMAACAVDGPKCQTCNDDPLVCASIPGLRHCEAATRDVDGEQRACGDIDR